MPPSSMESGSARPSDIGGSPRSVPSSRRPSLRRWTGRLPLRYNHLDMAHLEVEANNPTSWHRGHNGTVSAQEILKECVAKGTRQRMIVTDGVLASSPSPVIAK